MGDRRGVVLRNTGQKEDAMGLQHGSSPDVLQEEASQSESLRQRDHQVWKLVSRQRNIFKFGLNNCAVRRLSRHTPGLVHNQLDFADSPYCDGCLYETCVLGRCNTQGGKLERHGITRSDKRLTTRNGDSLHTPALFLLCALSCREVRLGSDGSCGRLTSSQ